MFIDLRQALAKLFHTGSSNSLKHHLVRGSIGTLSLKIFNTFFGLATGIILARLLGTGGYGTYAYALALINLITIPTVMGLPQLVVRHTAECHARKDYSRMRGLLTRANQLILGLSVFMASVAVVVTTAIADRTGEPGLQTFWIALILLPLLGLTNLRMATLRGLRHVVMGTMPEMLIRPLVFILILLTAHFILPHHLSPQSAMAFQVLATSIAFMAGIFFLMHLMPRQLKNAVPVYETRSWLKSALPFMFIGTMQLINNRTDIIMLGMFRSIEEVGIYQAVVQGAGLVIFFLGAINTVMAPTISNLYYQQDIKRLQQVVTMATRTIMAGTLPIILTLVFAGNWLLAALFGTEFGSGTNALRILCLGQLVNAGTGVVALLLSMTGHEREVAKAVFIAAGINIFLNLALIPQFGMEGAATATAISLSLSNLLLAWWVYKKIGILSIAF